jgi:hypothetical protein
MDRRSRTLCRKNPFTQYVGWQFNLSSIVRKNIRRRAQITRQKNPRRELLINAVSLKKGAPLSLEGGMGAARWKIGLCMFLHNQVKLPKYQ